MTRKPTNIAASVSQRLLQRSQSLGEDYQLTLQRYEKTFPALLEGPAPRIRVYSRESVVAEKLHAAALLGDANSRLKDFYDLFALSALFSFEGPTLTRAISATFARRRTPLPEVLPLPEAFFADEVRAGRWRAYLAKNGLRNAPQDFAATGEAIREFLARPYEALVKGGELPVSWSPGGTVAMSWIS